MVHKGFLMVSLLLQILIESCSMGSYLFCLVTLANNLETDGAHQQFRILHLTWIFTVCIIHVYRDVQLSAQTHFDNLY